MRQASTGSNGSDTALQVTERWEEHSRLLGELMFLGDDESCFESETRR